MIPLHPLMIPHSLIAIDPSCVHTCHSVVLFSDLEYIFFIKVEARTPRTQGQDYNTHDGNGYQAMRGT